MDYKTFEENLAYLDNLTKGFLSEAYQTDNPKIWFKKLGYAGVDPPHQFRAVSDEHLERDKFKYDILIHVHKSHPDIVTTADINRHDREIMHRQALQEFKTNPEQEFQRVLSCMERYSEELDQLQAAHQRLENFAKEADAKNTDLFFAGYALANFEGNLLAEARRVYRPSFPRGETEDIVAKKAMDKVRHRLTLE